MKDSNKLFSKKLLFLTVVFIFFALIFQISPSYAASGADITLIDSSPKSLTLEFRAADIQTSGRTIKGEVYQDITMPGTGLTHKPGKPRVPLRGVLVAVPTDGDIQIDILDSEIETRQGYLLSPAPFLKILEEKGKIKGKGEIRVEEVFSPDNKTYQSNRFWPESPVKIGLDGFIRNQRVAQIQFNPVLHNPVQKKMKVYKRLRIRVTFTGNLRMAKEDSTGFDRMLKGILINDAAGTSRVFQSERVSAASSCPDPPQVFSVNILVEEDGMYSLTYDDFVSYGIDMSAIDPRLLQMTHQGVNVPIIINGEDDGVFDQGDEILFYGEAMTGDYTRTNVYWLSTDQAGGTRMTVRDGTPFGTAPLLTSFRTTVHVEENNIYWSYMPNGEGKDHWFWDDLYGGQSLDMIVSLNNLAVTAETATVRVMLYGKTDDYSYNPDHHTKVLLNGVEIHDAYWNGQGNFLHEVNVSHDSLLEGDNTVTLQSVGDTGAVVDTVYVNYAEIDYRDTYTAENDRLRFNAEGVEQYNMEVESFSQANVFLYDITDPHDVVSINQMDVQPDGGGGYRLRFGDTINVEKTYLSFTSLSSQFLKPTNMENDQPSILKDPCNQADYIIIYHDSFDVTGLISALSGRGLQLMDVRVSDIYDEFNYGIFDPQAIKDFLTYAYENYNPPRPAYVLLVGDANQDYFNRYGYGINYVPTHIFQTYQFGDTASDNWFVSLSGNDPFPEMFLGRISVRTQGELDGVVAKLNSYVQDVPLDIWNQNVLMVADDEATFENISDSLIQDYLGGYNANKVYLSQYSLVDDATQDIINNIDLGSLLTTYWGHGSVDNWAAERMFETLDVSSLNNPDRLTFAVTFNCLNGWFSYYERTYTLSEEFLRAGTKGAIGVWSPTGLGYTSEHEVLANELFNDLFITEQVELGPLTTGAKISAVANYGISSDNIEIFTLFGDPTTRLQLPTSNIPPTANAGSYYSGIEGQGITLDGSGSNDSDGSIVLYEWDVDNNGIYEYSSSLPTQSHTYAQQGTYTIKLRVTDNLGAKDVALTTASVSDTLPTASFTASPTSGVEPLTVDLTDTSTAYDGILSQSWDFGDGSPAGSGPSETHVYSQDGIYTITLTVTDGDGSTDDETAVIIVNDTSPTADFTGTPTNGIAPFTVNFTDNSTGYDQPLSYEWDFDNNGTVDSTEMNPSYIYTNPGTYTVKLTVTDSDGSINELIKTDYITVCPLPVRIASASPVYYSTLQEAYDVAVDGDIIQSRAVSFTGDLNINRSISITLDGGYDCEYSSIIGETRLNGTMTISNGTLTIGDGIFVLE